MPVNRREFLAGTVLAPAVPVPKPFFAVHPFVEQNPKAVFIRRTKVRHKMDAEAKRREGLALARSIFVPADRSGVPVTHNVVFKPNWTSVCKRGRTVEQDWHTGTDPQFYEGIVQRFQELGVRKLHFIEANARETWNIRGLVDINQRLGVQMNDPERSIRKMREGDGVVWSKVPDAVVYTRIPHYAPVNQPDSWLLNIAKWKSHMMCLTQSVKNEQGLTVIPYVQYCPGWRMVTGVPESMKPDIHPRVEKVVGEFFERHRKTYGRYKAVIKGDTSEPLRQEIWAHKTCDNMSVMKTGLAMIEGIVSMGNTTFSGGDEFLSNIVMFGKDKFRLDVVGLYLAGHEPGNVHLYRIAKERGLTDTFNPWEIPVFEWTDDGPLPRKLSDFQRTPLLTAYLPLPGEPEFHMVDEPFDYDRNRV